MLPSVLPSERDERRDAADRNHPAEVIKQMVERELRASSPFGLEESPQCARLRLANDAALGRSLELDAFNAHGKPRVDNQTHTTTRTGCNSIQWRNATSAAKRSMGKVGDQLPQDMGQARAAAMVSDPRNLRPIFGHRTLVGRSALSPYEAAASVTWYPMRMFRLWSLHLNKRGACLRSQPRRCRLPQIKCIGTSGHRTYARPGFG